MKDYFGDLLSESTERGKGRGEERSSKKDKEERRLRGQMKKPPMNGAGERGKIN